MEHKLRTITAKVTQILRENEIARGDDYFLYYLYCRQYYDLDLERISAKRYFLCRKEYKLPNFESVGRARRKAQEEDASLLPSLEIQQQRKNQQQAYHSFALDSYRM